MRETPKAYGYLSNTSETPDTFTTDTGAVFRLLHSPSSECENRRSRLFDTTGYYTDEYGDSWTLRPIVARLAHGRGFLPGWTMGRGMSTMLELEVIRDEYDAWSAAHSIAERDAERERDYQASRCHECYDRERRGYGEFPNLCAECAAESPARTLALHATC